MGHKHSANRTQHKRNKYKTEAEHRWKAKYQKLFCLPTLKGGVHVWHPSQKSDNRINGCLSIGEN